MTKFASVLTLIITGVAALSLAGAGGADAQSRRELAQQIDALQQRLDEADQRIATLEGSGDPATVRLFERIDALEVQLATVAGQAEQLSLANQQLCRSLRMMVNELQIRDREYAQSLNLPGEFAGYGTLNGVFEETSPACAVVQTNWGGNAGVAAPGAGAAGGSPFTPPTANGATPAGPSGPQPLTPGANPFQAPQGNGLAAGGATGGTPGAGSVVLPNNPELALQQAQQLIIGGRYDEAETLLTQFIERFAGDPLVADAYFFRGETYFVRDAYSSAAADYISVIEADVTGPSAPEALVKLASSLNRLGEPTEACLTLDGFTRQFPDADPLVLQKADRVAIEAGCG